MKDPRGWATSLPGLPCQAKIATSPVCGVNWNAPTSPPVCMPPEKCEQKKDNIYRLNQ